MSHLVPVSSCVKFWRSVPHVLFLLILLFLTTRATSVAQQLAFPGAQGFGKYATGARGGTVYHVTTLADSGAGSFRDAVSGANRTIVFDVGGYINLSSAVTASSSLTIAGQTAPGGGIGLMGAELSFYGRTNIICRDLRVRQGGSSTSQSGINIGSSSGGAGNMIFDHTSVEFGQWDSIDAVNTANFTIQNCIIADPINQQFGAHVEGSNASYVNNLWINAHNRQPLAKANTVYINNVVYNYQAGYTCGNTAGHFSHDIINNYFIVGPSTTSAGNDFYQIDANQSIYSYGNLRDSDKNGLLGGSATDPNEGGTVLASPWSSITATIPTASTLSAYRIDVSTAGTLPRDQLDAQVVSHVTSLGTSGKIISSPGSTGLGNGGYGTIDGGTALADSDQDGMPDIWENATGSNPLVANNNTVAADGYTLLEHYLNWLAAPHAFVQTNATDIDLWPYTRGFTNVSPAYTFFNLTNCTVTLTNSHFAHFTPSPNFTGLASFNFAVTGNDGSAMTNTMGLLVSIVYIPKNLVWSGDGINNIWDVTNTADWFNGNDLAIFNTGDNVTFDDTGSDSPAINITGTVAPGSVIVTADQDYTFGGSGAIGGTATLTKSGAGTLVVNNNNSFTGPVTINSGTIQVNNGGTLGSGAITFQSGTLVNNYPSGNTATLVNPLVVPAGQTGTINMGSKSVFTGSLTGGGTLNLNVQTGTAKNNEFTGNASAFTGGVNILGSGVVTMKINGGSFGGFNNALTTMNTPVDMQFYDNSGGNTFYFGAFSGTNTGASIGNLANNAGAATLQIGGLNLDTTFAGYFQGTANLVKAGTGTFTLTGNSSHTGTTTVSGGTLLVTGNFSSSPVTVASGGTLQGAGFFGGGVTVQSGGKISPGPGNGSFGTMTVSNGLTLATPTLYFDLSSSPTGTNDEIFMQGGTLTMSGTHTYNFNLVNYALGAGNYYLITGATNSTAWGSVANNLPTGTRQTFSVNRSSTTNNPSYTRLTVTGSASSLLWSGTNGSAWDLSTTTNWLNGSAADKFFNLDIVRFDDTSTNGNVAITGTVQPATVLVTNNSRTYTIGGGALGGIMNLTKTGSGSLILNSSNSFSGGIFVNGGTLQLVTSVYAAGTGSIFLNGGTLYLNGVGTGATISSIGTNTLQTSGQPYGGFDLQGSGVLNLNVGGGGVFSPSGDWSGFNGTINFLTGNGVRELNTDTFGSSNAVWNFGSNGGLYNKFGGSTIYFGALFGGTGAVLTGATTASANTTTFAIGGINTNSVFNGIISDGSAANTALVFNGPGSLALTGNSPFSGGTTVNGGTLFVNNIAGSGTGSAAVSVNPGATLGGTGTIGGQVSLAAGATLAPGTSAPGTLTINNDLGLNNASVLQFQLGTNSDLISVIGDLTLGGTLNISDSGGFSLGTYRLFNYGGVLSVGTLAIGTTPASYTYTIDTSIQGQVNLIVSQPQFGNIHMTANSLVMSGSGGTPGANYYLLGSTNLALPLANWTRVLTNQFDSNGNFNFTNSMSTNAPQNFYRLQVP